MLKYLISCVLSTFLASASPNVPKIPQRVLGSSLVNLHAILMPVGGVPGPEENKALSEALLKYKNARKLSEVGPLVKFLEQYPSSPWRAFVHTTLGMIYRELGETEKARRSFEEVLYQCEGSKKAEAISLGSYALAELSDTFPAAERKAAMQKVVMRTREQFTTTSVQPVGWDAENRIGGVKIGNHTSEFIYDGFGRRVEIIEKDSGVVVADRKFLWVGDEITEERSGPDGGTVVKRFFTQGFIDSDGTKLFYTRDHLGSVRELVDTDQKVRARYDYDPWGRVTKISGDKDSDFLFTGHFYHAQSGLYLAKYRAYNPELGRWISRDPAGISDNLNMYEYADNDPVNMVDPDGMASSPWSNADNINKIIPGNNNADTPLIDSAILLCMMARESHFNPNAGIGTDNQGQGLLGVSPDASGAVNFDGYYPEIPEWNIQAGSQYLGYLLRRYGGGTNIHRALEAYRMGPHSKDKNGNGNRYANAIEECAKCIRKNNGKCKDGCFNKTLGRGM